MRAAGKQQHAAASLVGLCALAVYAYSSRGVINTATSAFTGRPRQLSYLYGLLPFLDESIIDPGGLKCRWNWPIWTPGDLLFNFWIVYRTTSSNRTRFRKYNRDCTCYHLQSADDVTILIFAKWTIDERSCRSSYTLSNARYLESGSISRRSLLQRDTSDLYAITRLISKLYFSMRCRDWY